MTFGLWELFIGSSHFKNSKKYQKFHCFIIWLQCYIDSIWDMIYVFTFKKLAISEKYEE